MNDKKIHGVFKITPITPIHISDSEKYQKFEYYIDDKNIFYLKDVMKFFQDNFENYDTALKIIKDLSFRPGPEYIRYTLPVYAEIIKKQNNYSAYKSSPNKNTCHHKHTDLGPMRNIQKKVETLSKEKVDSATSIEEVYIKEVSSFMKDPFGNFFIPGSSLKGCLRNAIINYLIFQQNTKDNLYKELLENKNPQINNYTTLGENDAKYDLFKYIVVRDSNSIATDNFGVCQIKVKSKKGKDFIPKGYDIFAECLLPNNKNIAIEFFIDIPSINLMFDKERNHYNYEQISNNLKKIITNKDMFIKSLLGYSEILLREQLSFLNSVQQKTYSIPDEIKRKKDNEILLQIGYGTGSLSKTITVLFSNNDRNEIANKLNWGKRKRKDGKDFVYDETMPYPKSRKLSASKGNFQPTLPMGWFKLEVDFD